MQILRGRPFLQLGFNVFGEKGEWLGYREWIPWGWRAEASLSRDDMQHIELIK